MKLFETHTHTNGVSFCSEIPPQDLPALLKNAGVDAFMLTNHYTKWCFDRCGDSHGERINRYLDEYRLVKEAADAIGIPAILGAEATVETDGRFSDFILYGVTDNFLKNTPVLYELSQRQLYKLCYDNGILMYQAHPYRIQQENAPADPEYMDGVEVNLHPLFFSSRDKVTEFAVKHNLGLTCGSDVHYHRQAGSGGLLSESIIDTSEKLVSFLKNNRFPDIFIR